MMNTHLLHPVMLKSGTWSQGLSIYFIPLIKTDEAPLYTINISKYFIKERTGLSFFNWLNTDNHTKVMPHDIAIIS